MSRPPSKFSRSDLFKIAAVGTGGILLASCQRALGLPKSPNVLNSSEAIIVSNPAAFSQAMSLIDISPDILLDPKIRVPGSYIPETTFTTETDGKITTWYSIQGHFPDARDPHYVPGTEGELKFVVAYDPVSERFLKVSISGVESDEMLILGHEKSIKFFQTAREFAAKKGYTIPESIQPPVLGELNFGRGEKYKYMMLSSYQDTIGAMINRGGPAVKAEAKRLYQEAYEMVIKNWVDGGATHLDPNSHNIAVIKVIDARGRTVNMALPFDFETKNDLILPVNKGNLNHIQRIWKLNAKMSKIDLNTELPEELLAAIPEPPVNMSLIQTIARGKLLSIAINTEGLNPDEIVQLNMIVRDKVANMTDQEVKQFIRKGKLTENIELYIDSGNNIRSVTYQATLITEKRGLSQILSKNNFIYAARVLGPILMLTPGTVTLPGFDTPTLYDDRTLLQALSTNGEIRESTSLTSIYEAVMRYKNKVKTYFAGQRFADLGYLSEDPDIEVYLDRTFGRTIAELKRLEELTPDTESRTSIREYIDRSIDDTAIPIPIRYQFSSDSLVLPGLVAELPLRVAAFEIDGIKNLVFWYPEQEERKDPQTGEISRVINFKPAIRMIQSKDNSLTWNLGSLFEDMPPSIFTPTSFPWPIDNMAEVVSCYFTPFPYEHREGSQVSVLEIECKLESSVK